MSRQREAPPAGLDVHLRLQHRLIAAAAVVLAATGWLLSARGSRVAAAGRELLGGLDACVRIHWVAGLVLVAGAAYHILYLGFRWREGTLRLTMLPGAADLREMAAYLRPGGRRPARPRFDYAQKFTYWAGFWGVALMAVSGGLRAFPDLSAALLPACVYELGHRLHGEAALGAALALGAWHVCQVTLRRRIGPPPGPDRRP